MDLSRIIADLKSERDTLAAAIESLEQLSYRPSGTGPGSMTSVADVPKEQGERVKTMKTPVNQ